MFYKLKYLKIQTDILHRVEAERQDIHIRNFICRCGTENKQHWEIRQVKKIRLKRENIEKNRYRRDAK